MYLLRLQSVPILEQLQIEEALLRLDDREWVILNEGSTPAIVLGISGKPETLVDLKAAREQEIPLIKRFSGGGTVYVDEKTLFVTFIRNQEGATPKTLHAWAEKAYTSLPFKLRENDYVIGDLKCGGNAQYIQKKRWLHHTSFLWEIDHQAMEKLLLLPQKQPDYREKRSHRDFLTPLSSHLQKRSWLFDQLESRLDIKENISINSVLPLLSIPHRRSTTCLPSP